MHDHVINQIAFTADDLQLIKNTAFAQWPDDGFAKREDFDAWLETTPINPTLRPYLWGLIGAHYPNRFFANWDLVGVFDCLQIRPGLILETRWDIREVKPPLKVVADAFESILDSVNMETDISNAICVITTNDRTDALEQMWACAGVSERRLHSSTALWNQTLVAVPSVSAFSLCVWLTTSDGTSGSLIAF